MQALAARHGHESPFVVPADRDDYLRRLHFFVPGHETEMSGPATVDTLWTLRQWGTGARPPRESRP